MKYKYNNIKILIRSIKMNIVKYYFPKIKCLEEKHKYMEQYRYLASKIKFSFDSLTYMSKRIDAELITSITIYHLNELQFNYNDITITDATAGIGGNTLSFSQFFKKVNAIEKDLNTFKMLEQNIDVYKFKNITMYNFDYVEHFREFTQQVVFIDPPWGGRTYKKHETITLNLSDIKIERICKILIKLNNIVVLKLPLNYDILNIFGILYRKNVKIFMHKLHKMFIFVIYKDLNFNIV